MTTIQSAPHTTNSARRTRHNDWRIGLIVAPLLTASLAASALLGAAAAPQVAGVIGHVAPATHTTLAVTPNDGILGGPGAP